MSTVLYKPLSIDGFDHGEEESLEGGQPLLVGTGGCHKGKSTKDDVHQERAQRDFPE